MMLKKPPVLLRLEGLCVLLVSLLIYLRLDGSIWWFLGLLLVPDLTMIGYVLNVRIGAVIYNAGHTLAVPLAAGAAAMFAGDVTVVPYVLIWIAHIGMDRLLGYGLKYPTYFQDTHLQRV